MEWVEETIEEIELGEELAMGVYTNKGCTGPIKSISVTCDRGHCM